jgi:hypothetical protein
MLAIVQIVSLPAFFFFQQRTAHSVMWGLLLLIISAVSTFLSSLVGDWLLNLFFPASARPPLGTVVLKGLSLFAWFFGDENRETFQMIISDLKRDRQAMASDGVNRWLIRCVICWGAFRSIIPIVWCEAMAVLNEFAGAAETIRKIVGKK